MRKGMTLLELIGAIVILSVLAAISGPIFLSMLREPAAATRAVQTDRTLDHMLHRLRQDVQGARGLWAGRGAETLFLAIRRDGKPIQYEFGGGRAIRFSAEGDPQGAWDVPGALIEWRSWPTEESPAALEVRTSVSAGPPPAAPRQALARTHLFFLAGPEAEVER
jgi:prepilin-type N-terminal cleavage/methylation domain-containing protein